MSDYSIYLDETTHVLFACQKLKDHNSSADLPTRKIVRKWWDYMADLMDCKPDNSPMVTPLTEVLHMD